MHSYFPWVCQYIKNIFLIAQENPHFITIQNSISLMINNPNSPHKYSLLLGNEHYSQEFCFYPVIVFFKEKTITNPKLTWAFTISLSSTLNIRYCFLTVPKYNFCFGKNKFMVFCISIPTCSIILGRQILLSIWPYLSGHLEASLLYNETFPSTKPTTISTVLWSISCALPFTYAPGILRAVGINILKLKED